MFRKFSIDFHVNLNKTFKKFETLKLSDVLKHNFVIQKPLELDINSILSIS